MVSQHCHLSIRFIILRCNLLHAFYKLSIYKTHLHLMLLGQSFFFTLEPLGKLFDLYLMRLYNTIQLLFTFQYFLLFITHNLFALIYFFLEILQLLLRSEVSKKYHIYLFISIHLYFLLWCENLAQSVLKASKWYNMYENILNKINKLKQNRSRVCRFGVIDYLWTFTKCIVVEP